MAFHLIPIVVLITLYSIQKRVQPYKIKENNDIDILALLVGTVTIYSGFIFALGHEVEAGFHQLAVIIVFFWNAYFLLRWFFLLLLAFEWKNIYYQRFWKILSLVLREDYDKIMGDYKSMMSQPINKNKKEPKKSNLKGRHIRGSKRIFNNYYFYR